MNSIHSSDASIEPFEMDENVTISITPKNIYNTSASLQIRKFHNLEIKIEEKKFKYNIFVFFFHYPIAKTIYIRLRIVYHRGLRNLQEEPLIYVESAPSKCIIKEEYKDMINKTGTGNIQYNCESLIKYTQLNIINVTLNTDFALNVDNKNISFEYISFDADAANESINIINTPRYKNSGSIDNAQIESPILNNYLRINGNLNPKDLLTQGDIIPMEILDFSINEKFRKINCTVIKVEDLKCTLECDISKQSINISSINMNLAKSRDKKSLIMINMEQKEEALMEKKGVSDNINVRRYRKSSRRFSKKAIITLVVTGVVVILAACILALVLRHPTVTTSNTSTEYKIDNTKIDNKIKTVDGVKNDKEK